MKKRKLLLISLIILGISFLIAFRFWIIKDEFYEILEFTTIVDIPKYTILEEDNEILFVQESKSFEEKELEDDYLGNLEKNSFEIIKTPSMFTNKDGKVAYLKSKAKEEVVFKVKQDFLGKKTYSEPIKINTFYDYYTLGSNERGVVTELSQKEEVENISGELLDIFFAEVLDSNGKEFNSYLTTPIVSKDKDTLDGVYRFSSNGEPRRVYSKIFCDSNNQCFKEKDMDLVKSEYEPLPNTPKISPTRFFTEIKEKANVFNGDEFTVSIKESSISIITAKKNLEKHSYFDKYLKQMTEFSDESKVNYYINNLEEPIKELEKIFDLTDLKGLTYSDLEEVRVCDKDYGNKEFESYDEVMEFYDEQVACEVKSNE